MILTHYHHRDDRPFQSLSSLSDEAACQVIDRVRDRRGSVYRRFKNPERYLKQRREVESWVRQEFIHKGGQPISAYPHYLTIGRSTWMEAGFDGESCAIELPISAFSPAQISFTYPDSMISYWLRSQTHEVFYHPEYHGRVFNLQEIDRAIELFGIPAEEWRTQATRKYDLFIEAQVWTNIPIDR